MMGRILKYVFFCLALLVSASCIENDLSYPDVTAGISFLTLEGQTSVNIDNEARTVDVVMGENADLSNVKILEYALTDDASVVGGMPEYLDLRSEVSLTLRVYEDFVWTIRASQPIERYIRCDNQVGEAILDVDEKTAYVYIAESQPLSTVKFNEMKLEPEGAVIKNTLGFIDEDGKSVPQFLDCEFPMVLDCVIMRYFFVDYKGEEIRWSVKVLQKSVALEVQEVSPWACFAAVKGETDGQGTLSVEYRRADEPEWMTVENFSVSGSSVTAEIRGLVPDTDYLVRFSNGEMSSAEVAFRTEKVEQLANFSYDDWYMAGKAWMPNLDESIQIWDTANPGSAGLGLVPTVPEDKIVVRGKAVKMVTAVAPVINLLAAGNIYTGKFDKLKGLGAELDWGVPFGARPLALRGYYKYTPQIINVGKDPDYVQYVGKMDQCQIQVFLAQWDAPFHVNSAKKQFVDRNDKSIIAFSEFYTDEENAEYKRFSLPIVYNDNRIPTYIVISACSSRFGNYFVGAAPSKDEAGNDIPGSLLYVDEFELVYDPDELTPEEYEQVFSKVRPI